MFVVRDGSRLIAATTGPSPTVGLVFYDLKSCLRGAAAEAAPQSRSRSRGRRGARRSRSMAKRRLLGLLGFGTGVFAGSVLYRRSTGRRRDRIDVYFDDGSMVSFVEGSPEAEKLLPRRAGRRSRPPARERRSARAGARRARLPRGRLPPALRQALALLPRQVPLRDPARPLAAARRAHRRGRRGARPGRHAARRARSSGRSLWPLRRLCSPACPSSSFGRRRRNTAPRNGSRARTRRASASA